VKVVGHQAKGMHLPAGLLAGLAQGFEKALPVVIVGEDGFAAVAPVPQMLSGTRILNSYSPRRWTKDAKKPLKSL
jgi:hypothetical protein